MVQPLTLLIIDDSPEDRQVYRRYLLQNQEQSYTILEEESGEGGLDLCRQYQPDCILLDFMLPDLDGLEFLAELKHQSKGAMPAVIMLTGYGNESVAVQAMKSGVQDYLVKGQTTRECLYTTIHSAIKNVQLSQELQRSEEQLRQTQQFLERIAETTPGILYVYDLVEQRNVYLNTQVSKLLGYTPEKIQALGTEFILQLMHPEDYARLLSVFKQFDSVQDGDIIENEYRMQHASGEWRWFGSRDSVFTRNPDGLPHQIIGMVFDITDRKQLEDKLNRLLQTEQAARAEAEAANHTKDEFVAMVSHDLRSPLNAILGWAKLLRTRHFDKTTINRALETIERNAQSQAKLLEDLLNISRILRGKLQMEVSQVNLVAIVEAAIETAYPSANNKNIHLESVIDQSIPPISGDSNRLLQVLGNLLSNAIKFTPSQGRVEVRLLCDNSDAQITISDTGIGISSEFLPHIFERYRQADRIEKQGGLGLGLAIARHLIELHGGTLQAISAGEGQGATFTIKLPI